MLQANLSPSEPGSFQTFEPETFQNFDSGKIGPESTVTSRLDEYILKGDFFSDDLRDRKKNPNTTECVPVPTSEHVAEIVGRQGCKIKALRAKTNTYIKTPARGEEPVFVVTGTKEEVAAAKKEILSAAEHFTNIRAARKNHINSTLALGQMMANTPGQTTVYVRVPYKVVGLVVGPKGTTIKRIQQQTHTYIVTPSRDKDPVFEVTGLPENVQAAEKEIESHIAQRTSDTSDDLDYQDFYGGNGYNSSYGTFSSNSAASSTSPSLWNQDTSGYSDTSSVANWLPPGSTLRSLLEGESLDFDVNLQRQFPAWTHPGSHDSGIGNSPCFDLNGGGLFNNNNQFQQPQLGTMFKQHQIWGGFGGLDIGIPADPAIVGISGKGGSSNGGWPDVAAAASLIMCATKCAERKAGLVKKKSSIGDRPPKKVPETKEKPPAADEEQKEGGEPAAESDQKEEAKEESGGKDEGGAAEAKKAKEEGEAKEEN